MTASNIKKMAKDARDWARTPEGRHAISEAIEAVLKRANELKGERQKVTVRNKRS